MPRMKVILEVMKQGSLKRPSGVNKHGAKKRGSKTNYSTIIIVVALLKSFPTDSGLGKYQNHRKPWTHMPWPAHHAFT